jgi:hypothetical protein
VTSDPDLEAETRFSPRSILDGSFPWEGVALWRGVVGPCPGCPERGGGEGGRGLHPVPCHLPFLEKGLRTFALTEQVLGPVPLVPGPPCPVSSLVVVIGRCNRQGPINKSPSESDTIVNLFRRLKVH